MRCGMQHMPRGRCSAAWLVAWQPWRHQLPWQRRKEAPPCSHFSGFRHAATNGDELESRRNAAHRMLHATRRKAFVMLQLLVVRNLMRRSKVMTAACHGQNREFVPGNKSRKSNSKKNETMVIKKRPSCVFFGHFFVFGLLFLSTLQEMYGLHGRHRNGPKHRNDCIQNDRLRVRGLKGAPSGCKKGCPHGSSRRKHTHAPKKKP